MAYEVKYAESFCRELTRVLDHLQDELDKPTASKRISNHIHEVKQTLETFPESYPYADDGYLRLREYRKALVGSYVLLFRIAEYRALVCDGELAEHGEVGGFEGVVHVTHLFHTSQNWPGLV